MVLGSQARLQAWRSPRAVTNTSLAQSYLIKAQKRLKILPVLLEEAAYSDVIREAQEIVKVYIRRIRRKVEFDPSEPSYIVNVRGFGYMLERRGTRRADRVVQAA